VIGKHPFGITFLFRLAVGKEAATELGRRLRVLLQKLVLISKEKNYLAI